MGLSITVAFLAETPGSASIEKQKASLGADDYVVLAGRQGLDKLTDILTRHDMHLGAGDRVKIFDLSCIALATTTLVRVLVRMVRAGITIEIVSVGLVVEPGGEGKPQILLEALDAHYRHLHGVKTHPADTAPQGRRRLLDPKQLPAIRAKLEAPGATATEVARELGVARSTLFNFLARYDGARKLGGDKKAE